MYDLQSNWWNLDPMATVQVPLPGPHRDRLVLYPPNYQSNASLGRGGKSFYEHVIAGVCVCSCATLCAFHTLRLGAVLRTGLVRASACGNIVRVGDVRIGAVLRTGLARERSGGKLDREGV